MDPFAMLGAPRGMDLDLEALEKTHRELSRVVHPDKFTQAGAAERRAALEKAASVNEAWRMLRDPIRRAEELFRLEGFAVGETNEPKAIPAFLMDVMDDREALAEARAKKDIGKVKRLAAGILEREKGVMAKLAVGFANAPTQQELTRLLPLLGELRFYRRFLEEAEAIVDEAMEQQATEESA